jgi:hypothetical protein
LAADEIISSIVPCPEIGSWKIVNTIKYA